MPTAELQSWIDAVLRVGLAVLIGGCIGINRDLHHKPIGLRTLGLVSLAGCVLTLTFSQFGAAHGVGTLDAGSRAAQGLLTGIGFLGAGVILRSPDTFHVYGLTTAATILVVAALGVACGLAVWPVLAAGMLFTFALLMLGGPIERAIRERYKAMLRAAGKEAAPDDN